MGCPSGANAQHHLTLLEVVESLLPGLVVIRGQFNMSVRDYSVP